MNKVIYSFFFNFVVDLNIKFSQHWNFYSFVFKVFGKALRLAIASDQPCKIDGHRFICLFHYFFSADLMIVADAHERLTQFIKDNLVRANLFNGLFEHGNF